MASAAPASEAVDDYVRRLLWALQDLPQEDRLSLSEEILSHLMESQSRGDDALQRAFAGLGPPNMLARSFIEEFELAGAVNRAAPGQLLVTMVSRGSRNLLAFGTGTAALLLYVLGFAFGVIALAKPIVPHIVGLWRDADGWRGAGLAAAGPPPGSHDVLGYWIVPVAVILALTCYAAATRLLRNVAQRMLAARADSASRFGVARQGP